MKPKSFPRIASAIGRASLPVLATALFVLADSAGATDLYWNGAGGAWNSALWSATPLTGTGASWVTGDVAVFDGGTYTGAVLTKPGGTVTLASAVSVAGITFTEKTYILKPTSGTSATSIITLGASGITIPSGNSTIQNIITGTNGLTLTGTGSTGTAGTLILTGANTYTGDTVLGLGAALQAAQGTGLPSTSYLKLNGGIYETIGTFTRANSTTQSGSNFTWSGGGGGFGAFGGKLTVTIGGSASITQTWGTVAANDTIVGPLVLGAQDSDAEVDFQNNINLNKGIRTISVPLAATGAFATISGVISGTGTNSSLSKSLLGTLVLSNTNTYSGATTVTSGKLTISSTGSINSTSGVSIGAAEFNYNSATALSKAVSFTGTGGTLSGSGTITPLVTVTAGNTLAPGNSIGTLSFGTGLTLAGTYAAQLGTAGATPAVGISDRAVVTGNLTLTGSTLSLSDNANANLQGSAGAGAYRLMTYTGSLTGTFGTVTNPLNATLHENVVYGGGNVDLNLYRLATATAPSASAALGNVRVGSNLTGSASVTNSASSDGFSELLMATVTGSGSGFTGVAGGASGTLNYSLATSAAGTQSGSASVVLKSTGVGSYGNTTLSTTSVTLSGTAYNYASPTLNTAGPVAFGNVHVGAANPTGAVSITNTTITNASYQDSLNAGATTDNGKVTGNTFTAQSAGTTGSLTLTANASTVGSLASTVTLGYVSNANGVSGLSNLALSNGSISTTGLVYSGQSTWSGGSGSWGTLASGFGTNWGANQGSPGLDAGFTGVDTATFNGAGGTVSLDTATPSLNAITLNGGYTLAQGSGGSLTLAGTTPGITASGINTISAGLSLASGTNVAVTGTGTLDLSGTITGSSLTKSGSGTLSVSGNYSGAVTVNGGILAGLGTIGGNVDVNATGTLAPGAADIGKLTVAGSLTMAAGSTFAYEMNSSTHNGDLLVVEAGGVSLGANVELSLNDLGSGTFAPGTTLSLIQYEGSYSGLFTYEGNELSNDEAFIDGKGNHWTIHYNANSGGDNFITSLVDSKFISLSLAAIPEVGGLLGLGFLMGSGAFFRSRRRGSNLL